MPEAFINRIATANPPHDVHDAFLRFGHLMLRGDNRRAALFGRMAERSGITHRYSFLEPGAEGAAVDTEGFYRLGAFPDTAARMKKFEACSPGLAVEAVEKLLQGEDRSRIRKNPGVFARLRSFGFNILKANRIETLSQDRYRAALGGFEGLLEFVNL